MYSHYAQENRAGTVSQITPTQLLRGGIATSEAPGVLVSALGQLGLLKEARPKAADVLPIDPNYHDLPGRTTDRSLQIRQARGPSV